MIETSYLISRNSTADKHLYLKTLWQQCEYGAKHRRKIIHKKVRIALDTIAFYCNNVFMSILRDAVLKRMSELNMTTYRLAKMVEGTVRQRTVYTFISGEADASSEVASALMQALDLEITVKVNAKRSKRSRK